MSSTQSTPIIFKIDNAIYWILDKYLSIKNISLSQFLTCLIKDFIFLQYKDSLIIEKDLTLINDIKNVSNFYEKDNEFKQNPIKTVSVRLKNADIEIWDDFCSRNFIKRTSLFKKAIYNYLSIGFDKEREKEQIKQIPAYKKEVFYNLILGTGAVGGLNFSQICNIFNQYNKYDIEFMLNQLENEGKILKKGVEPATYVPIFPLDEHKSKEFIVKIIKRSI